MMRLAGSLSRGLAQVIMDCMVMLSRFLVHVLQRGIRQCYRPGYETQYRSTVR